MTIAAQAYTIRSVMPPDVPGALHRLREIGYEHVELAGLHGLTATEMARALAGAGVGAISAHVPWPTVGGDADALAADMRELGITDVVVPSMPPEWREGGEAGYREFGRLLGERAAVLAERSLRLHYHNHRFELESVQGGEGRGLDTLIAATPPELGFELDLAWVRGAGADPAEWVRRIPAGRLRIVHMKDVRFEDGEAIDTEVGRGVVDWPPVIAACRQAEVPVFVVEQDRPGPDPFQSLAVGLAATRTLLEG